MTVRVHRIHNKTRNLMATKEAFISGDDLDAIFGLIDEDIFEKDAEFTNLISSNVLEVFEEPAIIYKSAQCEKVCKSTRGLKRHLTMAHSKGVSHPNAPAEVKVESILHPLKLKKLVQHSIDKFEKEQLYPDAISTEIKAYKDILNITDILITYSYIREVISQFKGDAEQFYRLFYNCVTKEDNFFKDLSRNCCLLLGFELANHLLAHLNKSSYEGDIIKQKAEKINFSEKDHACIGYFGGYVFGTFYRRIRNSKKWQTTKSQQCLALLLAGKCSLKSGETEKSADKLVNAKNRGGLWTVTAEVLKIFSIAEIHFCESSSAVVSQIYCPKLVNQLLQESEVISNFTCICNNAEQVVEKEVAMDMLESLLTLYVRVRAHSYAKNIKEKHMVATKKQKTRSLRTEMKRKSSSQEQVQG